MLKTYGKFLHGTAFIFAMTPAASWADETSITLAQNLAPSTQSAAPISAAKTPKTTINWTNLMKMPTEGRKGSSVGRGFGDSWNKYAWSMKNIGGGMLVGTKNAFYDTQQYISPSGGVKTCLDNNVYRVTGIHAPLACMELFASPAAVNAQMATSVAADTRFAEIWRFDYVLKKWSKVVDESKSESQGFRVMEIHNNKVYVGSDLGAFITGVDLKHGRPGAWDFPGSKLLSSTDGKTFSEIPSCASSGPCTSAQGLDNPYGLIGTNPNYTGAVNTSIRALASFNGKLYVGTFNSTGGQLWAYDDTPDAVNPWKFIPLQGITTPSGNPYKPAIMELRVYNEKLYIGIGGPSGNDYLYRYDGSSDAAVPVPGQPALADSNVGVIKLFTSSDGLLYIGNTDLTLGFSLQTYNETTSTFTAIEPSGFGDSNNAYAWSMAEFNGRLYLGTFNQNFSANSFSASAQLWYKENGSAWQKATLPSNFGPLNYGIRNLEVGNSQLFLGTASNMLAPDLVPGLETYQAGAEVWTIR